MVSAGNPFTQVSEVYVRSRPTYSDQVINHILDLSPPSVHTAVDVGAGTGKMALRLIERGINVHAVEPSQKMRELMNNALRQLQSARSGAAVSKAHAGITPKDGTLFMHPTTGEATGLPSASADLVVCAQAWHWLDEPHATKEMHRILRENGLLAIVWNQLDVSYPWIHRLTRIMRSGDVHRRNKPPVLGEYFTAPKLFETAWSENRTPEEIIALGATRSSYLQASESYRARMRSNLEWYLYEDQGLQKNEPIALPYYTLVWTGARIQTDS